MALSDYARIAFGYLLPTFGWPALTAAFSYELLELQGKQFWLHAALYFFGYSLRAIQIDSGGF